RVQCACLFKSFTDFFIIKERFCFRIGMTAEKYVHAARDVSGTCIRFFTAFIRLWIKAVDNDDIIIMKCLFNIFFCGKERIISLAGEFSLGVGVYFIGYGLVF